jgi:hypothetical protein
MLPVKIYILKGVKMRVRVYRYEYVKTSGSIVSYSHDVHMHLMNAQWVDWGMEAAV